MKLACVLDALLGVVYLSGVLVAGCQIVPRSPIVGKWRHTDPDEVLEFLPTGKCSAVYGDGRHGTCEYSIDKDQIIIHWHWPENRAPDPLDFDQGWQYSVTGDTLNVIALGSPFTFQRIR